MRVLAALSLYLAGGVTFVPLCLVVVYIVFLYTAAPLDPPPPANDVPSSDEAAAAAAAAAAANPVETKRTSGDHRARGGRSTYRSGPLVVTRHWPCEGAPIPAPPGPPPMPKEGILTRSGGYVSAMYRGFVRSDKVRAKKSQSGARPQEQDEVEAKEATEPAARTPARSAPPTPSKGTASSTKKARPGDASFHAVLKESILYLYRPRAAGQSEPGEVYAAIDLRGARISIYGPWIGDSLGPVGPSPDSPEALTSGIAPDPIPQPPGPILDAELFLRRNAVRIVAPTSQPSSATNKSSSPEKHPMPTARNEWFVFAPTASDLEDWYFALFRASLEPPPGGQVAEAYARAGLDPVDPVGEVFSRSDMLDLMARLDEVPDPLPLRWFNALLGRYWVGICHTAWTERALTNKLRRKLSRIKTPAFLGPVEVVQVTLGSAPPLFGRPMLKALTPEGEASMEASVHYKGQMRVVIATVLTLGLPGLKNPAYSYGVPLSLAVDLRSLEGNAIFTIKPPPSNRIWWAFTRPPQMNFAILPGVSARQVQWALITRTIEAKIKELVIESLVMPNMDDITFFDTSENAQRGGIWADAMHDPPGPESETKEQEAEAEGAAAAEAAKAHDDHGNVPEPTDSKFIAAQPIPIPGTTKDSTSSPTPTPSPSGPTVALTNEGLASSVDSASIASTASVRQRRKGRKSSTPLSAAASLSDVLARNDTAQLIAAQKRRRPRPGRANGQPPISSLDEALPHESDSARRRSWFQRNETPPEADLDLSSLVPGSIPPSSATPDAPEPDLFVDPLSDPPQVEPSSAPEEHAALQNSSSLPTLSVPPKLPLQPQLSFDHLPLDTDLDTDTPTVTPVAPRVGPLPPNSPSGPGEELRAPSSTPPASNEPHASVTQYEAPASEPEAAESGPSHDIGSGLDRTTSIASSSNSAPNTDVAVTSQTNDAATMASSKSTSSLIGAPLTDAADRPAPAPPPKMGLAAQLRNHIDGPGSIDSPTSQTLLNTWRRATGGLASWTNRRSVALDRSSPTLTTTPNQSQPTSGSATPHSSSSEHPVAPTGNSTTALESIAFPSPGDSLQPTSTPIGRASKKLPLQRTSSVSIRRANSGAPSGGHSDIQTGSPSTTASSSSRPSFEFVPTRARATVGLSLPGPATTQQNWTDASSQVAKPRGKSNKGKKADKANPHRDSASQVHYAPDPDEEAEKEKVHAQPLGAPSMVIPGMSSKAKEACSSFATSSSNDRGRLDASTTSIATTGSGSPSTPKVGFRRPSIDRSNATSPTFGLPAPPSAMLPAPPRAALARSPERNERHSFQAGLAPKNLVHDTFRPLSGTPTGAHGSPANPHSPPGPYSLSPELPLSPESIPTPSSKPQLNQLRPSQLEDETPSPTILAAPWGAL